MLPFGSRNAFGGGTRLWQIDYPALSRLSGRGERSEMMRHLKALILFSFLAILLTGCQSKPPAAPAGQPPQADSRSGGTPSPPPDAPMPGGSQTTAPDITANFAVAKKQIDETIAADPKNHNLRMQAAEFYMKIGRYAEAVPHLQEAVKLSPEKVLAWIALGDAASLAGNFPIAQKAYDRARKMDPNNPFVYRGRGQMLILQRRFNEARAVLEEGVKKNPKDVEVRTALGNLYLILNKPRLAINTIQPIIQQAPNRPDLHYLLGDAYERDLHVETAIKHMQETVRLDPMNAEAWGRIGLYHINLTRYKQAREPLQRAITLRPDEPHFYWALGDSYLFDDSEPDHFSKARDLYKKALQLDPNNPKALYSYGMGLTRYGEQKDLEEALEIFQKMIRLNPNDMNAHYKLYETFRRLGRMQEAEAHKAKFKDLFAKGRQQTRSLYASASFRDTPQELLARGRKAMQEQNYPVAEKLFQLALERDAKLKEARRGLEEARRRQR
jgi:pentatricopeptide repeat protein